MEGARNSLKSGRQHVVQRRLYHYQGYGLLFESELELPWPQVDPGGEPDVLLRIGEVPEELDSPADGAGYWQTKPGTVLLNLEDSVRCQIVAEARQIRVVLSGGDEDAIMYLLDTILAACLHMRGVLALHASAIATTEGAVLFTGIVGSGKSTLVAALVSLGYPLVADGIVGVTRVGDNLPTQVLSGFPQVRLWKSAINALDEYWHQDACSPVRHGINSYTIFTSRFHDKRVPVHTVYVLDSIHGEIVFENLSSTQAFAELTVKTCRTSLLHGLGQSADHFQNVVAIIQRATVKRLLTPRKPCPPSTLACRISACLPPPA